MYKRNLKDCDSLKYKLLVLLIILFFFKFPLLKSQNFRLLAEYETSKLNFDFLNPDNIAKQPSTTLLTVLLYNQSFKLLGGRLAMDWRGESNTTVIKNPGNTKDKWEFDPSLDAIECYYTYSDEQFSLSIGRKKIKWGVGYVNSPTAIVSKPPGPDDSNDHLYRLTGSDVVQMSFTNDKRQFDVILLPSTTNNKIHEKQNAFALRYYRYMAPFDLSLVGRLDQTLEYQVGLNSAVALGSALEIHGEFLFDSFNPGIYPASVDSFQFISRDDKTFRFLFGGQWSPSRKLNWVLEYLHFNNGYNEPEWNDYFNIVDQLKTNHSIPQLAESSDQILLSLQGSTPVRKSYLFSRWYYRNQLNTFDSEIVTLMNLLDYGTLFRLANTWKFKESSSFRMFMHHMFVVGSGQSEFSLRTNPYTFRFGVNWVM